VSGSAPPHQAAPLASSLPSAPVIAAILAGALVATIALVALLRRRPDLFAPLVVLALPFRLPISTGGRTVNLLIPLYVVVAAGSVDWLITYMRDRADGARSRLFAGGASGRVGRAARELRAAFRPSRLLTPRGVQLLLALAVALYALQTLYSPDRGKAAENIVFFYLPFGVLFLLLRRVPWTRELLLRCLGVAVVLAVVLAGIGFVEYARKSLFLNPKVVAANQYDNYFRVNSLFFDPNIYGRFLALVMVALATVVMWARERRLIALLGLVLAWLVAGLVTSFSQSSIAALLLGLAVIAAWRWDVRVAALVSAGVLALAGAAVLIAPASLHFGLKGSGGSTSNATSGRTKLISGGLELFADRPLQGWGAGSFETEYKRHGHASAENATSASHTIPITVAAEQGIVGLAVYVALLVAAFAVLFRGAGRSPPRIALAACFAALALHTWTYADFLEDPFTWALLAIGVSLAAADAGPAVRERAFAGASAATSPQPAAAAGQ
jgi:O-antigen ligase